MNHICPISGLKCSLKRTLHVTDINDDGNIEEMHLCHQCGNKYLAQQIKDIEPTSSKQEVNKNKNESLKNILQQLDALIHEMEEPKKKIIPYNDKPCSYCNYTIPKIIEVGRIGCDHCYDTFYDELKSMISAVQNGKTKHVGKSPKYNVFVTKKEKLQSLKLKLAKAIELEQYEEAAKINQEIKDLES